MARWERSSLLAAGGYHHHIGINHAGCGGAPPPHPGSLGMRHFELHVGEFDAHRARLGADAEQADGSLLAVDQSGNRIVLRSA